MNTKKSFINKIWILLSEICFQEENYGNKAVKSTYTTAEVAVPENKSQEQQV